MNNVIDNGRKEEPKSNGTIQIVMLRKKVNTWQSIAFLFIGWKIGDFLCLYIF
tara:strand:- start:12 stop:170 length:159 start_codon:yes stop_codon:yes gene_type:complete